MLRRIRIDPLSITAYLTLLGIAAVSFWEIERILVRWLAMGLLVAFAILQSRLPELGNSPRRRTTANLILLAQTGLALGLIVFAEANAAYIILFFILSVNATMTNPLRLGLGWLALYALLTAWYFITPQDIGGGVRITILYTAGYLFFGVTTNALAAARLAQAQNNLLLVELRAKNQKLEEYARQVETLAIVEERNRLAREVHDTIGHRLTAASVQLEGAQRLLAAEPERAGSMLANSRQQVRDALQDLRQTVGRLREPVEIELSLPQALRRLAAGFEESTSLPIHLEIDANPGAFTPAQRLALYRCAQEGLTNIQRHAHARQAWLRFTCAQGQARLQISDDGVGVQAGGQNPGFGLRGMQERAAQLGGSAVIASRPEGGSILTVEFPLKEA